MITVRSTINLAHQSVPNVIPVVQGDTGRSILFTLADFTIPTGATARYFITKPSGLAVYNDATIDGNTVLVDLTAQSLAEYGDCPGQVRISVGDTVVTSFEFILHVEPFRGIDAVESSTETNIFDQAMNNARETIDGMIEDAEQAIEDASETAEAYIAQAIDPTLTIEDKAADAKATGDAIRYGAYPFLTAGQLLSTHETTDNTPYNFRTVEQESTLEYGEIVGGTVAWNQLFDIPASVTTGTYNDVTITNNNDGSVTINGTASAQANLVLDESRSRIIATVGHKYAILGAVAGMSTDTFMFYWNVNGSYGAASGGDTILSATQTFNQWYIRVKNGVTVNNVKITPQIIDLTQMLGTTLADYVYGLESATAGAGVAWLRNHFAKMFTYHAYDAGSLQSVEGLSHHVTTGKNLIPFPFPSGSYITGNGITWTNNNGRLSANGTASDACQYIIRIPSDYSGRYKFTGMVSPNNAAIADVYMWDETTNTRVKKWDRSTNCDSDANNTLHEAYIESGHNIDLICRVQSGSSNGVFAPMLVNESVTDATWQPYATHTYPLDSTKAFRGIYKLDSANKLYADGDVYKPDGTVQRRYAVVDLGTLNWSLSNSFFLAQVSALKPVTGVNLLCTKYISDTSFDFTWASASTRAAYTIYRTLNYIYVKDTAYDTAATFKTAMSGVYLVYELATPTTESADPYANPQIVAPGWTEEYISTSVVPVGHESSYPLDIAGQLDKILDTPTADGTYTLRATVSGGKVTYSWVSGGNTLMSMRPMQTVIDEPEEEEPVEEEFEEEITPEEDEED